MNDIDEMEVNVNSMMMMEMRTRMKKEASSTPKSKPKKRTYKKKLDPRDVKLRTQKLNIYNYFNKIKEKVKRFELEKQTHNTIDQGPNREDESEGGPGSEAMSREEEEFFFTAEWTEEEEGHQGLLRN